MPAICRIDDQHSCGAVDTTGSPNVFANGMPVHRIGDQHDHVATQEQGSETVFVNGKGVARLGDNHSGDAEDHPPNPETVGSSDVFAG